MDYEVLSAKHELTLTELKKKVQKANTSLTDTQSSCLEQTKAIGCLEVSNTDLVSCFCVYSLITLYVLSGNKESSPRPHAARCPAQQLRTGEGGHRSQVKH